jgi:endonuclease/exonuclease/phosphatase family metal-dependent hydrolase
MLWLPHRRTAVGALALLATLLAACGPGAATPAASSAAATTAVASRGGTLKLATWNMEWLIAPETLRALRANCVPDGASPGRRERFVPCRVATELQRSATDFTAIARYAKRLDADVIALQEVDGPGTARRVFPDHEFCFTSRKHVQNTGFAIRRGLPFRCSEYQPLSLNGRVRRGAELVLFPGEPRELHLLSVHLKSGCGRRTLDSGRDQCTVLASQVPELERWIDTRAARGLPFAVLGDFNRDLLDDRGPARASSGALRSLWAEIDDGEPAESDLALAAEGQRFTNCAPNQNYGGFIDHIVLSRTLAERRVPGSFDRVVYDPADALRLKLPDHCPVAVSVRLAP